MLILEAKPNERFLLEDEVSGSKTRIKVFYRDNGSLVVGFDAPSEIRITRVQRSALEDGNRK